MKSEKDEEKGKQLQEISDLVQELVQSINVIFFQFIIFLLIYYFQKNRKRKIFWHQ